MKRFVSVLLFLVVFVIPFYCIYAADESVVLEMIVESAEKKGSAAAQFYLGEIFYYGQGAPQNYKEAVKWYKKAAEQGDAVAQSNLGVMYHIGEGVTQNYNEAMEWYKKAAEQGDAAAQSNLGVMYAKGEGVPQDYIKAHMWFNLAAAAGNENAKHNRDVLGGEMTPTQIVEAQKLAAEWKPEK